jgi:hypothetical protein
LQTRPYTKTLKRSFTRLPPRKKPTLMLWEECWIEWFNITCSFGRSD